MIIIEVDCNSDIVTIKKENSKTEIYIAVKHPRNVELVLVEALNALYAEEPRNRNVRLDRVDEDNRKTIDEW